MRFYWTCRVEIEIVEQTTFSLYLCDIYENGSPAPGVCWTPGSHTLPGVGR